MRASSQPRPDSVDARLILCPSARLIGLSASDSSIGANFSGRARSRAPSAVKHEAEARRARAGPTSASVATIGCASKKLAGSLGRTGRAPLGGGDERREVARTLRAVRAATAIAEARGGGTGAPVGPIGRGGGLRERRQRRRGRGARVLGVGEGASSTTSARGSV